MIVEYFKKLKREIPTDVWNFLQKSVLIFIVWKLLYHLVLYPIRQPDKWLTDTTTMASGNFLNSINADISLKIVEQKSIDPYNGRQIIKAELWLNNKKVVRVGDGCNGLELYVIYISFLIALWKGWKRFAIYLVGGVILIFISNTLRIAGLSWVNLHSNKWFDFAHGYAFKLLVYLQILILWFFYAKNKVI